MSVVLGQVNNRAIATTAKAPKNAAASLFDISHITGLLLGPPFGINAE